MPNDSISTKNDREIVISKAEYEYLLRDKHQLALLLAVYMENNYSLDIGKLLDYICKIRGMKA